jgi:hypothetical protein
MSRDDLKQGTNQVSITFTAPGVASLNPVTYETEYSEGAIIVTAGNFINLSPAQISVRQQVQDDSKYKLNIDDTAENRTITSVYSATIDGIVYNINGQPKHPQFSNAWINVYISKKEL